MKYCILLFSISYTKKKKKLYMSPPKKIPGSWGGARNFYLRGPSCNTNIFIKTTSHIHIYTCFFIIYTFFYLISYIYIYTHTQKKKKSLIFSIKIMFDGNFSWNKIHFYHFYSEILKKCHFRYKWSNFILK